MGMVNRPVLSCPKPLFQSTANVQSHWYQNDFLFSCKWNSFSKGRFFSYPHFENEKFLEVRNGLFYNNTDFTRTLFTNLVYLAVVLGTKNYTITDRVTSCTVLRATCTRSVCKSIDNINDLMMKQMFLFVSCGQVSKKICQK